MGFGILEPTALPDGVHVPGTVQLLKSQDSQVVSLNPKPSDSPNDPLRWPLWRKYSALVVISFGCLLCGIQGTNLAVATIPIIKDVGLTLAETESLTSYSFPAIAVGCASCAVLARLIGKRPVYLTAACLGLAGCIWNATGTSYGSLVGSRVLYGVGAGAFESLPLATIGDVFYVHERGRSTAFFSFFCLGFTQLSPVLGGYLTDTYGWRSQYWALIPFWVILVALLFFLVPETTFHRDARYETDITTAYDGKSSQEDIAGARAPDNTGESKGIAVVAVMSRDQQANRRSYMSELKLYRTITHRPSFIGAVAMFVLTGLYPIVWFSFLILGSFLAWYIGINVTLAQIFGGPPIDFGSTKLGFLNTFGIIGAGAAEILLHSLADGSVKKLARRNNNIHEPEFRLVMLIPSVVITVIAYPLFGWYAGVVALERDIDWTAAAFLFGMVVFTLVNGQSVAYSYLLDAHREISIEAGMFAIMLRSLWTYGASTFLPLWLEHSGVAHTFYEMAGLQAGLVIFAGSFMYAFGKRVRYFMSRHNPMITFRVSSGGRR